MVQVGISKPLYGDGKLTNFRIAGLRIDQHDIEKQNRDKSRIR